MKCDVFDGSILGALRQAILISFNLDKPARYKVFYEPETFHHKTTKKSALNTITFYLENDNHQEVNFNGQTLTITLQLIKF